MLGSLDNQYDILYVTHVSSYSNSNIYFSRKFPNTKARMPTTEPITFNLVMKRAGGFFIAQVLKLACHKKAI